MQGTQSTTPTHGKHADMLRQLSEADSLLNSIPYILWIKDIDSRFIFVNQAFEQYFDCTLEEIKGKNDYELRPDENALAYLQNDKEIIYSRESGYFEEKIRNGEGILRWFETFKNPLFDDNLRVVGIAGMARDITERKFFAEKLMQSEANLKSLFHSANDAFILINKQHKIIKVNRIAEQWYKQFINHDLAEGDMLTTHLQKKDSLLLRKGVKHALAGEKQSAEWMATLSGICYWFEIRFLPATDESGNIFGVAISLTDITERKASNENLSVFKSLVEHSSQAMYITDLGGRIIYSNPAFTRLMGYSSANERAPFGNSQFHKPELRYWFEKNVLAQLHKNGEWSGELDMERADGSCLPAIMNASQIPDSTGRARFYTFVITDISVQKQVERELIAARDKAESADKLKSAFLANMSHEIRTPMNGIVGFANLMDDHDLTYDKRREYVQIINSNSQSLLKLIDDIIDIAKIEAGQLSVELSTCKVDTLLSDLYTMFNEVVASQHSNLQLRLRIPIDCKGLEIISDAERINQILANLINNALKFTPKGFVEFGVNRVDQSLHFFVHDSGIGIPQDKLETIFERFRQVEDGYTSEYRGTGLGLAISKHIVELLGGSISVTSTPGAGSRFSFILPLRVEAKNTVAKSLSGSCEVQDGEPDWSDKVVLVAEDEEINYMYIRELLKRTNVNLVRAKNGLEAVNYIREGNRADLVLMDIKLPKLNGLEATQQIKACQPALPVIAQTAYAMQDEKANCLAAGCNDYISKPIRKEVLLRMMNQYFQTTILRQNA